MKRIVLFIAIATSLMSCQSTYFFSSLKAVDGYMEKEENGNFLLDGDSLWIAYSFRGENAPVQITVFNKMSKPLYVDWARSALVIGDIAYSYSGNELPSEEVFTYSDGRGWGSYFSTSVIDRDSEGYVSKIKPNRFVNYSTLRLNVSFNGMKNKEFKSRNMGDKEGNVAKVKSADFTVDNSPLAFSSYLTTYTNEDKPIVYQQDFYISNLIKTKSITPRNLPGDMSDRGDMFYVEKPANTSFIEGLLGATLAVGAIALEVALDAE